MCFYSLLYLPHHWKYTDNYFFTHQALTTIWKKSRNKNKITLFTFLDNLHHRAVAQLFSVSIQKTNSRIGGLGLNWLMLWASLLFNFNHDRSFNLIISVANPWNRQLIANPRNSGRFYAQIKEKKASSCHLFLHDHQSVIKKKKENMLFFCVDAKVKQPQFCIRSVSVLDVFWVNTGFIKNATQSSCQNDHTVIRIKPLTALKAFSLLSFFFYSNWIFPLLYFNSCI